MAASLDTKISYTLHMDAPEFSLLCRAMAGKLTAKDKEDAAVLRRKMLETRAKSAKLASEQCQQHLDEADKTVDDGLFDEIPMRKGR